MCSMWCACRAKCFCGKCELRTIEAHRWFAGGCSIDFDSRTIVHDYGFNVAEGPEKTRSQRPMTRTTWRTWQRKDTNQTNHYRSGNIGFMAPNCHWLLLVCITNNISIVTHRHGRTPKEEAKGPTQPRNLWQFISCWSASPSNLSFPKCKYWNFSHFRLEYCITTVFNIFLSHLPGCCRPRHSGRVFRSPSSSSMTTNEMWKWLRKVFCFAPLCSNRIRRCGIRKRKANNIELLLAVSVHDEDFISFCLSAPRLPPSSAMACDKSIPMYISALFAVYSHIVGFAHSQRWWLWLSVANSFRITTVTFALMAKDRST